MRMKSFFRFIFVAALATGAVSGCSGGGGGEDAAAAGGDVKTSLMNATITAPIPVDAMNVVSGVFSKSTVSGTRASVSVNSDILQQIITIENNQGPVLAVMAQRDSANDIEISARSTAEALVRLHPFLIRLSPDEVVPVVQSSAAVATLAAAIDSGMKSNPNFIISQDPGFTEPYRAAVAAVIEAVVANEKARAPAAAAAAQTAFVKKVSPGTVSLETKSGVQVNQVRLADQPLSGFELDLANVLPRYCMAYLDAPSLKGIEKKTLGPAASSAGSPTDWIPQAGLSWVADRYPQAELRVYGPSFNVGAHAAAMAADPDFQVRMSRPTLLMLINEFLVPWMQAFTGVNFASSVSFADDLSARALADPDFVKGFNVCIANGNYVSIIGYLQYFLSHMSSADAALLFKNAFLTSLSTESTVELFLARSNLFGSPLFAGSSAIKTLPAIEALYSANPVESWQLCNEPSTLNLSVDSIKNLTVDFRAGGSDMFMYQWFFGTDPATAAPDVIEFKNGSDDDMTATTSQETHVFPGSGLYTVTVIGTDVDGAQTGQAVRVLLRSIDHIVVTCDRATVGTGGKVRLTARAYDASDPPQEIASVPLDYLWEVTSGSGSVDANGYFTAGSSTGEVTVRATYRQGGAVPPGTATITVTGSTIFVSTNVYGDGTNEDALSVTIGTIGKIIDRPGTPPEAAITAHSGDILSVTLVYDGRLFTPAQYGAQTPLELLRFYTAEQHVPGGVPFAKFSEEVTAGLNTYTYSVIVP